MAQRPLVGQGPPLNEWSARRGDLYVNNTQHSQQTNIHAPRANWTHNPSKRGAADHVFDHAAVSVHYLAKINKEFRKRQQSTPLL
jgi:hypothetical protein